MQHRSSLPDCQDQISAEPSYFSPVEERFNVLTHGLGFGLSLLAIPLFARWTYACEPGLRVTCAVFTCCMAAVYLCSTLSHAYQDPVRRNRFRAWDQGTIYLLIVGTYSPFIWAGSQGQLRIAFLAIVWTVAILGFLAKVVAKHQLNAVSTLAYLALGWLPALPLIKTTPLACSVWILLGGISFTLGVPLLLKSHQIRHTHAAWHCLVILGSTCHCVAIYQLVRSASE